MVMVMVMVMVIVIVIVLDDIRDKGIGGERLNISTMHLSTSGFLVTISILSI